MKCNSEFQVNSTKSKCIILNLANTSKLFFKNPRKGLWLYHVTLSLDFPEMLFPLFILSTDSVVGVACWPASHTAAPPSGQAPSKPRTCLLVLDTRRT